MSSNTPGGRAGKVAVLGAGNGGRTIAADLTLKGHDVCLFELPQFADRMSAITQSKSIDLRDESAYGEKKSGTAQIGTITTDIQQALGHARLVLVAVPSFAHATYAEICAPHVRDGQVLVLLPGTLGTLEFRRVFDARKVRARAMIAETDTLPYATRIDGPRSVQVYHRVQSLMFAALPASETDAALAVFREAYPMGERSANVLEVGLSNCNPVLHPAAVLLNAGRIERSRGDFYLYEEGMTPGVIRALEAVDAERRAVGHAYGIDLPSMADTLYAAKYGPKGDLWEVLNASKGLTPIQGPGYLAHRYLSEDVPVGLVIWEALGKIAGVPTPTIHSVIQLVGVVLDVAPWTIGRTLERCGIADQSVEQIKRLVSERAAVSAIH